MTGLRHAADDDPHGALPTKGDLTSTLLRLPRARLLMTATEIRRAPCLFFQRALARWKAAARSCSGISTGPPRFGVDPCLCGFLNDPANLDGQLWGPVEHQHTIVGQQHRGNARGNRGPEGRSFSETRGP